ncbi:hypothetical protein, partial [Microseira wollei]|uniref:hypothetical protein n=1 Tax=Microseira wollei TaxID=467598 RepID=UPI001CFC4F73
RVGNGLNILYKLTFYALCYYNIREDFSEKQRWIGVAIAASRERAKYFVQANILCAVLLQHSRRFFRETKVDWRCDRCE